MSTWDSNVFREQSMDWSFGSALAVKSGFLATRFMRISDHRSASSQSARLVTSALQLSRAIRSVTALQIENGCGRRHMANVRRFENAIEPAQPVVRARLKQCAVVCSTTRYVSALSLCLVHVRPVERNAAHRPTIGATTVRLRLNGFARFATRRYTTRSDLMPWVWTVSFRRVQSLTPQADLASRLAKGT
jgi:hypothetical protein